MNYKVLQTNIENFSRSLLQLAYTGKRQKFIMTFAVQKCLLELWNNGYITDKDCRIDADPNQLQFHRFKTKVIFYSSLNKMNKKFNIFFYLKDVMSYFSFGILAPLFQYKGYLIVDATD